VVHALRWEAWPENGDAARSSTPPAGELKYYRMNDTNVTAVSPPARARAGSRRGMVLRIVDGRIVAVPDDGAAAVDLKGRVVPLAP
jgi:hypothetical protein